MPKMPLRLSRIQLHSAEFLSQTRLSTWILSARNSRRDTQIHSLQKKYTSDTHSRTYRLSR